MKDLFLACERGCSPYVEAEARLRSFGHEVTKGDTCVVFHESSVRDLLAAAYLMQTPTRVGALLCSAEVTPSLEESLHNLETAIGSLDFERFLSKDKSFSVVCSREGTHDYNSIDLAQETGRVIRRLAKESLGEAPRVDIKKPDILLYLHVDEDQAWLSLDLLGYDASKRPYKVFNNPHSMKGPTAASLLMASGWTPGKVLVDPYAGGGEVPIEAALMASGKSLRYYEKDLLVKKHHFFVEHADKVLAEMDKAIVDVADKTVHCFDAQLRNITAAKKNAKIAGVDKAVEFSKMDVEWLDTKLTEKSVDCIVTQPIEASKHVPQKKVSDLNKQLFYQADFVLAKAGSLTFLCQKPEDLTSAADEYGFVVDTQEQVFTGKLPQWVVRFVRK
ncbi:MAG: THUMP domain-containing protein [Candidatus Woesearchaeota archaeon]